MANLATRDSFNGANSVSLERQLVRILKGGKKSGCPALSIEIT